MPAPLGYLITWTTYGTWLPGDRRGWVEDGRLEIQPGDAEREEEARGLLLRDSVVLDQQQRNLVETVIRKHCAIRKWHLHAVNVRSNHVHVVVTADAAPEAALGQFKAWAARCLSETTGGKQKWWTKGGSTRWINEEEYLHNAIRYVLERQ